MTARLTLLCHAATDASRRAAFGSDDEPVRTDQAPRLAVLAGRLPRFGLVIAAPARAARETAEALGLDARPEPALADQDFGRWRGQALADVLAAEPAAISAWMSDPHASPHGGETTMRLIARVGAWLAQPPSARGVLAVTHAAVVRAAMVHVLGAPAASFWTIDAGPLSAAHFTHDGRRWRVRLPSAGLQTAGRGLLESDGDR